MLHALVIYSMLAKLALTALPLAIHPRTFAFAYPQAPIDSYDGYVPLETTQSQRPGDVIEARQAEALLPIGGIILILVVEVMATVDYISQDKPVRLGGNDAELLAAQFNKSLLLETRGVY